MAQDIRAEFHFYGRKLDQLAIVYYKTSSIPVTCPDILFFSLFVLKLFTNKRLNPSAIKRVQEKLTMGVDLRQVFDRLEDRPFDPPMMLREYSMVTKSVIRSQILFRGGEKFTFMLGSSGFGVFSNRRYFDHCVEGSIFGLMEKLYHSFQKDPTMLAALFSAATLLGEIEFQAASGFSLSDLAWKVYLDATGKKE